jgi:4-amino-4-deoxy-L-arabinose transferase-like glycosyltransferase
VSRAHRTLWLVALGALALRLAMLLARGDYIVYDEGYYLLLARSLRAGHGFTLNGLPHVALSPLQPVLVALLSSVGVPDLWVSRLLAASCGALLVIPVASLADRAGGPRAALPAAIFTAASPALMTFAPFFPGRTWNLYFGSEPLFLLLAFAAVAAAMRAEEKGWKWWGLSGAFAAASYLARAEGLVLCCTLLVVVLGRLALRQTARTAWRGLAAAVMAGLVVAAPYLGYLRWALGRWAVSGRVQAASSAGAQAPSAVASARSGGEVLEAFVWQGQPDAFVRAMYGLDASGTRMASQYWGVERRHAGSADSAPVTAADDAAVTVPPPPASRPSPRPPPDAPQRGVAAVWWEGVAAVVPWWLGAVALIGAALASRAALAWFVPLAVCAVLPSALAYVEPRSLLPLAPLAAACAGVAAGRASARLERRWAQWPGPAVAAAVALLLLWPAVRDLAGAWREETPLQRVAAARRAVGEYLDGHLAAGATVMSFHPAVAIWARRPWRVLPYDTFERIVAYAQRGHVQAVVFSRFEPSPMRQPPRPFTVILPGAAGGAVSDATVQVVPVDETPLLFVGRLAPAAGPP